MHQVSMILILLMILVFIFILKLLICKYNQNQNNELDKNELTNYSLSLQGCKKDGKLGLCVDTNKVSCNGQIYSGLCSGSANIKCCISDLYQNCLEIPGGERIKDNSELLSKDSVSVQAPDVSLPTVKLHKKAASAYLEMIAQARKESIKSPFLGIVSGYRSDATQKILWDAKIEKLKKLHPDWTQTQIEKEANKWVARPGYSNHRSGRTVDLVILNNGNDLSSSSVKQMKLSNVWKWLNSNASKFGFYPYTTEPWHWEYNPKCI